MSGWMRDIAIVVGSLSLGFAWIGLMMLITGGQLNAVLVGGLAWCIGRGAFK